MRAEYPSIEISHADESYDSMVSECYKYARNSVIH